MPMVNSVLGPLDTANLGFTLPHEHLLDSSAGIPHTYDELINRNWALEAATEELTRAHNEGVDTIVEVSPMDLGRDVKLMHEVSSRTRVNFICCTGCWLDVSRSFYNRTPEVIASLWVREIEEGIEGTGIKAGIIKVATSDPILEPEELMLRAAARAHHRTGVPITTHTPSMSRIGEEQIRIFEEEGVDLNRVYIGHINNTIDKDYHHNLIRKGVWLGWDINNPKDRAGLPGWKERTDYLKELLNEGGAGRLMLSHDWNVVLSRVVTSGFPTRQENPDGYLWLTRAVLPRLRDLGASEAVIQGLMVDNPRRYFEGS